MNVGTIITRALQRNQISVTDFATREMAKDMLDEIIQTHWHSKKWKCRRGVFYIQTSDNVEEYGLNKLAGDIVPNTMRGSDPIRMISYKPPHDFYLKHPFELASGDPYIYRDGEMWGVQTQPSASSQITIQSSLANYTTGTVTVVFGSQRVTIATGAFTIDMLGRWLRVGSDNYEYRISKFISSSEVLIDRPYEGTSASTTFVIGDVHQKVTVEGFDSAGNYILEEEVKLNGTTGVVTVNSFAALNRISKSERTVGRVTATSNSALITNISLDPGETEADFRTIKFYPIPTKGELLTFESYARHPFLYKDSDSPLFPSQWHPFLLLELMIKLKSEFLMQEVPSEMLTRRASILDDMRINDNDTDEWNVTQETEQESYGRAGNGNLPENYGAYEQDYF